MNIKGTEKEQDENVLLEKVEFLSDGVLFKGKVYHPEKLETCKGIVIFTHGLGYCDRQYKINGESFAKNGYLIFIYNLRGHANTDGAWTLEKSVHDLIEAINFLTGRFHFKNNDRICVIGHSTGALISLLASLKDKRIKFGSMVTTVTCLTDSYLHWFSSGFNQGVKEFFKSKGIIPPIIEQFLDDKGMLEKYRKNTFEKSELAVPHRYGMLKCGSFDEFFHEIAYSPNIIQLSASIAIPLLLFRGEYDEVMDVRKTNELYEKLNARVPSKLFITDSKNHFHNDRWDLIQETTLNFFDEYCSFKSSEISEMVKNVLVVDDDMLVSKSLGKALETNKRIRASIANSGEEALEKIQQCCQNKKSFDLVVADIRMPGLDGIETISRMKKIMGETVGKESPVIFITGYEGGRSQTEAKALGYVDYLHKPIDLEVFLRCVVKQLGL